MKMLKALFYICLSIVALLILAVAGDWLWTQWEYHLPSDQWVHQQFENQKTDYIRLVTLLRKDPSIAFIGSKSNANSEYRNLIHKIGAKNVIVREDGSMEFALKGFGCTICSDSYKGVRYVPNEPKTVSPPGWTWTQTMVDSLESTKLPQENGSVTTGLYVVPIEPNWFIYRLEIQE